MVKINQEFELSAKTLRQLRRLATDAGKPVERIISEAVELYDKGQAASRDGGLDDAAELSPELREIFSGIMKHIGRQAAKKMTTDQLNARGKAGGKGRAAKLTPAQRKAQAKKAAAVRWGKEIEPASEEEE